MPLLLDTSVAIGLRDGDPAITQRLVQEDDVALLSVICRIELENGVYRDPALSRIRRVRLDQMLLDLTTVDFKEADLQAYRRIVEVAGYSRRKMLDRMIAAQALTHDATLVTCNADDFRDVPGLAILEC